jgi:hypothetical protein
VTIDPLDDNNESFITDENGVIGDQDRELVEDGDYVLNHGCEDRDFFYVEADPAAARGYAVSAASNYLVNHVNKSGYKVDPPAPPADTSDFHEPIESPGAIPNSDVKPDDAPVKQTVTATSDKK